MMKRMQQDAVLLSLINEMKAKGSWCGETHIQKAAYFLQALMQVPMSFEFILYKHGPYSFDLSDEVTALRADRLLEYKTRLPYGPSLFPTKEGQEFLIRYPKTLSNMRKRSSLSLRKLERWELLIWNVWPLLFSLHSTKTKKGNHDRFGLLS